MATAVRPWTSSGNGWRQRECGSTWRGRSGCGNTGGWGSRWQPPHEPCLESVTDWNSNSTTYSYDDAGRMTSTTLPSGTGIISSYADGLGSTMAIVDGSGNSQKSYTYDIYGEATPSGGLSNEFDFAGQQTDATGLQYLRARYYDPETGVFLSRAHGCWTELAGTFVSLCR
ncbi:MAG: hypothetical protein IPF51_02305 [Dehalococcoidia bacterium]|uniref:RHS repeat domain-containing protein n=1 Tax=Candidatus Amarobacter glycogenicus TaxID=3140699 RepID=UPI0031362885|nr:hypothetical protein [Dehalococcoidia bacterium]